MVVWIATRGVRCIQVIRQKKCQILDHYNRRMIEMENRKRANEIKVYLTDREFQLAENRRSDWEDEFGIEISRSQFLRKVLLAWDQLADLAVENQLQKQKSFDVGLV
jgi:hypothetical protein